MADKSFGVKDINLIGASGTPEIESPNNLNINAVNVAISTDMSVGGELTVTDTFLKPQAVGLGTTTATGRDAGISTATGTIIYIPAVGMQVYSGDDGWKTIADTASSGTPITATGGSIVNYTADGFNYKAHIFTSSQAFAVTALGTLGNTVDYLIVGGGGGGANHNGGGGGGGGTAAASSVPVSIAPYAVVVGSGGVGGDNNTPGATGGTSSIAFPSPVSKPGGEGGLENNGGGNQRGGHSGNYPPTGAGGSGATPGGGGGGAGGNGGNGTDPAGGGNGGIGIQSSLEGTAYYYGGGGGGSAYSGTNAGAGGSGGGGAGGHGGPSYNPTPAVGDTNGRVNGSPGTNGSSDSAGSGGNSTGGGGGGSNRPGNGKSGSGGSGIVVIRYRVS
nr:hypothetical protein [uncultured Mediterranean phage uvMED]